MKKICIVIAGPTAVGKTTLAIQLAQQFNTQIISADSRQCFKELNIGVAKPSPEQLQLVKHYFINSHSVTEDINAVVFEQYALKKINEIFTQHDIAVMVGGTGLYIKAFCNGIDEVPVVDMTIRKKIISEYELLGLEWLQQEVQKNDPAYFTKGEIKNPQRLMRALEVKLSSGKSILDFQTQQKKQRNFNIIKIGLELSKEELYKNINRRVDEMIEKGLPEEVKQLQQYKNLTALQTVGYRELFDYEDGILTMEKVVEQIKLNTRHYAKRQMTWFKKDMEMKWVSPHLPVSVMLEEISLGK